MKRARLDSLYQTAVESTNTNNISMNEALARVGMRHAYLESDQVGIKMWSSIVNDKNPFEKQQMSVEDAVALEQDSNSDKSSWNKFRKSVKNSNSIPKGKSREKFITHPKFDF